VLQNQAPDDLTKQKTIGEVSDFIEDAIEQFKPDNNPKTAGRPRVLPSLCLWSAMLLTLLKGQTSQLAIWRMIRQHGVFAYAPIHITDQAVYKRLETETEAPLQRLFVHIQHLLSKRLAPLFEARQQEDLAPFATEIISLDEMTFDQAQAKLPELRGVPKGDDKRIPGKIAALFDVRRQQWRKIEFVEDFHQNCKVVAREVVEELPARSLLLADLGYFAFAWFDWLTDNEIFYVSRLRQKTSKKVIHTFYQNETGFWDGLIHLGAYRADKAAHAVRMVCIPSTAGLHTYITNVTDPQQLSAAAIAGLYARRWDIESAFRMLKQYLNLHLLWSAKPVVVKQQLWCTLILSSILYGLRWEIALRADVDLFDVSLPLMIEYLPQYFARASEGSDALDAYIRDGLTAGFIRPSRRKVIIAPSIDPALYVPAPPDLIIKRTPRYAQKA